MFSRNGILIVVAVVSVGFVCHAAIGAKSDDGASTAHAIAGNTVANDTSTLPDFDGDGTIGFGDFVKFAAKFGLEQGEDGYDARYDLNGDGEIGFSDFVIFAQNFGKEAPSPVVAIPDANLRAVINTALGKASGAPVTQAEMTTLERLFAPNAGISVLTGLEFANNLNFLSLPDNNIRDISVLSGLTKLDRVYLPSNGIADISALSGLTKLGGLKLGHNNIEDISPLAGLANLTYLALPSNGIADISALSGMTNLTHLYLEDNDIGDISSLAGLINLQMLGIGENNIADISALAELADLEGLSLQENSISDISALSSMTKLHRLKLGYNNRTLFDSNLIPTRQNSGITDISPLAALTNLTSLELQYNSISDISALSGLTKLRHLILQINPITDISALSGLTNLGNLVFGQNNITDISPLSGLTKLRHLILQINPITDISALSGLTNLESLVFGQNNITDISPLSGLTKLQKLVLENNSIADISALSGLTNLVELSLSYNNVTDISPLRGLTNLEKLSLWFNNVTDISPLRGLTNLTILQLRWNLLNNSSLNVDIPALQGRGVTVFFSSFRKGDFDIDLVFLDAFTEKEKNALRLVARRWMSVIAEDLPDYEFTQGWPGRCGDHTYEIPAGERIDDLRIYMTTFDEDDRPNAVGWGGPRVFRDGTHMPVLGCMGFDLERANLLITGLHEVGHVLGFGTTWRDRSLLEDFSREDPNADTHFSGPLAIAAFDDAGGRDYRGKKVPVKKMDGAHWRIPVLHGELMGPGGGGNLSAITVQSFADLGYGVDVTQADPYTLPGATAGAKIATSPPSAPGSVLNLTRPDGFYSRGADRYGQGRIPDGPSSILGDARRTGRLESTDRLWGHGENVNLWEDQQMRRGASPANAEPELTCGAGLMNEPIYVVDRQGRVVRTIHR